MRRNQKLTTKSMEMIVRRQMPYSDLHFIISGCSSFNTSRCIHLRIPRRIPAATAKISISCSASASASINDLSRSSSSSSSSSSSMNIDKDLCIIFSPPKLSSSLGTPSLHPLHETVRSECEPWILSIARPPSLSHRQFLLDCLLPRYVCRLFPTASLLPRLLSVTKLYAWLILADDIEDDHASVAFDSRAADAWSASVLAVLSDDGTIGTDCTPALLHSAMSAAGAPLPPGTTSAELLLALADVWRDISRYMPGNTRERFLVATREHLDAVILQSSLRSSSATASPPPLLSVAQYMAIRRPASALPQGMELLPYVLGMDDDAVHHHPLLAELRSLVVDHMCICNDVFSCGVEMAKGDYFNLPCVLYGSGEAASMQEALEYAAQMAENVDSRCREVVEMIEADRELMGRCRPTVMEYVETMVAWMAGTIEWGRESARYRISPASTS